MRDSLLALAILVGVGILLNSTIGLARASGSNVGLKVSPAEAVAVVKQGSSTVVKLRVTNTATATETVVVSLSDYGLTDDIPRNLTLETLGSHSDSFAPFVTVSPTRFDLASNETTIITLQLSPGQNQVVGRYRGAVIIGPELALPQSDTANAAMVGVTGSVATLIGVTVEASDKWGIANRILARVATMNGQLVWTAVGAVVLAILLALGSLLAYKQRRRRSKKQPLR